MSVRGRIAALAIAVVALVGCREERTLDADQLERELIEGLLPEYPGAIESVDCPAVTDPMAGDVIECEVQIGAAAQTVDVTLIDAGGDQLAVEATLSARLVAVDEVSDLLATTFANEVGVATAADCGAEVLAIGPDEHVDCRVTDPTGVVRTFRVTVDDAGAVAVTLR